MIMMIFKAFTHLMSYSWSSCNSLMNQDPVR